MPINFRLDRFADVSDVFLETGTYKGNGVIKALEAGFRSIATVEISSKNQAAAKKAVDALPVSAEVEIEYILGDAEHHIGRLCSFAKARKAESPVFWLDAHTHIFEDGARTEGNSCPLLAEIDAINAAFDGSAVVLIDDLRIIGSQGAPPLGAWNRVKAAKAAIFSPNRLIKMIKPGWGRSVDFLTVMKLAARPQNVSFRLLDGVEPMDVLCVYPTKLHKTLFG